MLWQIGPCKSGPANWAPGAANWADLEKVLDYGVKLQCSFIFCIRVAGLGRLSAGAKMAMKPFVKRVIKIFATNASFLRVISNFRI